MPHCQSLHSHLRPAVLAVVISFICLTSFTIPSKADIGPDPWAPGSNISPSNPTQVRMVEEYVQMDLLDSRVVDPLDLQFPRCGFVIKVQADFRMKNLGVSTEEEKVYFPLGVKLEDVYYDLAISDFQVWVNDQPVNIHEEQYHVDKEKDPFNHTYTSAVFNVRFPTNQDTLVHVTYTIGSKYVPGVSSMESIAYVFETGAGWKGNIGKAVLVVNLLDESSQESVMTKPANGIIDGHSITWTWTNFEPVEKDNFYMVLVNPRQWEEVIAARLQVDQNPKDGSAWTWLATRYLDLATGKLQITYPYFARLAKSALQKAIQQSPYDPEPHYQLYHLYVNQIGKLLNDPLTQEECDLLVSEMNQFLIRDSQIPYYDQELDTILGDYGGLSCPNKPKLTSQRGIFPTLTQSPITSPTATQTEYPFAEETLTAFRKTHYPGLEPLLEPSATLTPTWTAAVTKTSIITNTKTPTPSNKETPFPTHQPSRSPIPARSNTESVWFGGWSIFLIGTAGFGILLLWQYLRKNRAH